MCSKYRHNSEADVPNSVTYLNQTPNFEKYMVRCVLKKWTPKRQVFKRGWTMCSNIISILSSIINVIGGILIACFIS